METAKEGEKKNIAIIRSKFSLFGGAETLTLGLLQELLKTGHKIHLLTCPKQQWPVVHPNLHIVQLGIAHGHRLWQLWAFERAAIHYLKARVFPIVLSIDRVSLFTHLYSVGGTHRTFLNILNPEAPVFSRWFRKLSLYHASTMLIEAQGLKNPWLEKIYCCSRMVAENLQRDHGVAFEKLQIVYIGVAWETIGEAFGNRESLASSIRQKHELDRNKLWLLFLGSGFKRKGLDIAIEGLAAMPQRYGLLVVGKGNRRPFLEQARRLGIASRIRFLGPRPQGWQFASVCSGLVLPARYEPFGMAPAEAQGMGLPVLVSGRTGYAELVQEGTTGLVIGQNAGAHEVKDVFRRFAQLIETPRFTPAEIRNKLSCLDEKKIFKTLVNDLLGKGNGESESLDHDDH